LHAHWANEGVDPVVHLLSSKVLRALAIKLVVFIKLYIAPSLFLFFVTFSTD